MHSLFRRLSSVPLVAGFALLATPLHAERAPSRDASRYFEADPRKPRVLKPSKLVRDHGLDRGYIEAMVRPPIDPAHLDRIEASRPSKPIVIRKPDRPLPGNLGTRVGNVLVLQGANYIVNGSFDLQNSIGPIAQEVLGRFGDNFDFISVWMTSPDNSVAAYYLPLAQDTENLGNCNQQNGETFGCVFNQFDLERLQGFVFMNSVSTWQQWDAQNDGAEHPLDSFDSACYSTLGQEIAHRWGSGLRFKDGDSISNDLLGRDGSHWSARVDTQASVMDGWDWQDNGDGTFTLIDDMNIYGELDLYTMGAISPGLVQPFFQIKNARYANSRNIGIDGRNIGKGDVLELGLPSVSRMADFGVTLGATGERQNIAMQQILDAEGMRCPSPDTTQRAYRQAFVLLTGVNQSEAAAQGAAEELGVVQQTWEAWWADRTNKAITLCTALDGDCAHATIDVRGKDFVEASIGGSGNISVQLKAGETPVKGVHVHVSVEGEGKDGIALDSADFDVGEMGINAGRSVDIGFRVAKSYRCGVSTAIDVTVEASNAETKRQRFRVLPGYNVLEEATFADGDDGFTVNDDGKDGASLQNGGLQRVDVAMTCDMTTRSPERDNSPSDAAAFVTNGGLDGDTTLWSKKIDLSGTLDPQLRFAYWLDGSGSLRTQLSSDGGKKFRTVDTYDVAGHTWSLGTASIRKAFDGELPETVVARFLFEGNGKVEGGIDDVRVVDVDGVCAEQNPYNQAAGCGCDSSGQAGPQASVAAVVAVWAAWRRRRRTNA